MILILRVFILLYFIAFVGMYMLAGKNKMPITMPGDVYFIRGPRTFYIPIGSALIISLIVIL